MHFTKLIFLFLLLGLSVSRLSAQIKIIPYQELPTSGGNPNGSGMFFGASLSTATITITFSGPSDRWIGIGFGIAMPNTDALIYSNGQTISPHPLGWNDYSISSYNGSGVVNDIVQNWNIQNSSVSAGQRTVVASRVLNTGDTNDAIINYSASSISLVWARGSSADYDISYHGSNNRANNISLQWLTLPTASFVSGSFSVCSGNVFSFLNQSTGGGLNYFWNFEGGSPATSTLSNPSISYTLPGTFSVGLQATNALGSSTLIQNNYIVVNPTPIGPSITVNGNLIFCEGDSVVLISSAPFGNSWSNGAISQSIAIYTTGTYAVSQSSNPCNSAPSIPVSVSVHPHPNCSIAPAGPYCIDDSPQNLLGNPIGGVFSGIGIINNVFTPSLSPTGTVLIIYNYTDGNNCIDTSSQIVIVSECLGLLKESQSKELISVFPNPSNGFLHIASLSGEIHSVSIFNSYGIEVLFENMNICCQVDLTVNHFAKGIYFLKIEIPNQTVFFKLCLQN